MARDDDLDRRLRQLLDEIPPHDDRARRATLEALPTTRQRRFRWWPTLGSARFDRPSRTYAGLAVASLVLIAVGAIGIASLERLPQAGTGPPDMHPPDPFTGTIVCGPVNVAPTTTGTDIALGDAGARIWEGRGGAYTLRIDSIGDPRLTGTLTNQLDVDRYGTGMEALEVGSLTWTLENEDGVWTSQFASFLTEPNEWSTATLRWDGSGGYGGLVAITQLDYLPNMSGTDCGWEVHGLIVSADLLPAYPEPDPLLRPSKIDDPAGT